MDYTEFERYLQASNDELAEDNRILEYHRATERTAIHTLLTLLEEAQDLMGCDTPALKNFHEHIEATKEIYRRDYPLFRA